MSTKHSHTTHADAADLADAAEETAAQASEKLTSVLESTKAFVNSVRDKAVATAKATDKAVQTHPYKSLAIATGIGLAFGYLMARRCGAKDKPDQD